MCSVWTGLILSSESIMKIYVSSMWVCDQVCDVSPPHRILIVSKWNARCQTNEQACRSNTVSPSFHPPSLHLSLSLSLYGGGNAHKDTLRLVNHSSMRGSWRQRSSLLWAGLPFNIMINLHLYDSWWLVLCKGVQPHRPFTRLYYLFKTYIIQITFL